MHIVDNRTATLRVQQAGDFVVTARCLAYPDIVSTLPVSFRCKLLVVALFFAMETNIWVHIACTIKIMLNKVAVDFKLLMDIDQDEPKFHFFPNMDISSPFCEVA